MEFPRVLRAWAVTVACGGLVLPGSAVEAGGPTPATVAKTPARQEATLAHDVGLDRHGNVLGLVVDVEGSPVAHAVVVIQSQDEETACSETDGLGRFVVGPLRGGTYQLKVGGQSRLVRVWAGDTAPPTAKEMVLIVLGGKVVRGQLPLEDFFASNTFIIVGLVAAAIAIPIAVHTSGGPASAP